MEKPLAVLFVDIADSTQLYERIGNVRAAALAEATLLHLRVCIERNGGFVVKMLGDGLLAAFPTADDACRTAGAMMESQVRFNLKLRIGINYGNVVQGNGDLYGDACNVAARVEALARPGEILATEDFVRRLSADLQRRTKPLSNVAVKGKTAPVRIHEVRADDVPDDAIESTTIAFSLSEMKGQARGTLTLHLTYQERRITLNRHNPRLTVGRDEASGLRVLSRQSSRQHGMFDFSRESFIITDHSTNGTFVRPGDSPPMVLRRDSAKLVGTGLIGFGAIPQDATQDHVAAFRVELM
ncbi:MAG TPA: adenylate/guanylate cyclase domain-containing protein [Azospirillum sp.]